MDMSSQPDHVELWWLYFWLPWRNNIMFVPYLVKIVKVLNFFLKFTFYSILNNII